MEFLRRSWAQIQAGLGDLSTEKKIIIGLCLVIMLTVLGLWLAYAGDSSTKALLFAGGRTDEVVAALRRHGISAEVKDGQAHVPASQEYNAINILMQNDLMTEDPSAAWSKLVGEQSPWETRDQAETRARIAMQTFSAGVIRAWKGVNRAQVLVSPQPRATFGDPYRYRTASVTVWMEGRRHLDQPMVESIAAFIAGGDANMRAMDVSISDGNNGKTHKVGDPNQVIPTEALALVRQHEALLKEKVLNLLGIAGLRVAVNVQVDSTHQQSQHETEYEKSPPVTREMTEKMTSRTVDRSAEPGVRSNVGASINNSSQAGTSTEKKTGNTEFGLNKVVKQTNTTFIGHQTKKISVSLGVPRGYFVALYKARNPDVEGEPDGAALSPIVAERLADFERRVQPIIESSGPGVIVAAMYEDASTLQLASATADVGGFGALASGPWMQPAMVGVMVLGIFGMMLFMVRKATRPESLPSVEELAGLPPHLPSEDDLVGDVEESEATMTGVEVDEADMESRKIAEQISDLIRSNPSEATSIIGKWVRPDE